MTSRKKIPQSTYALTIAGSDCSGGAGIQADLKTFSQTGVYGASAITCVVAEHAQHVGTVMTTPPRVVAEQITLCREAHPLRAAKTGMLPTPAVIRATLRALEGFRFALVVDPVMVASTGTPLISQAAVRLLRRELLPQATLMTPNLHEAEILLDGEKITAKNFRDSAQRLSETFSTAVFLKGGHLPGAACRDVLSHSNGLEVYESRRIKGINTHGTGCTLSAVITSFLAQGNSIPTACEAGKNFLTDCIQNAVKSRDIKLLNHQFLLS